MKEEVVLKSIRKLRKLLKKAPKRPDPEFVHDLRTRSRKYESMLMALEPDARKRNAGLLRIIKRVRSRAGKVRDMDVLTANAAGVKDHDEQQCRIQLLEELGVRRSRQSKKLARVLSKHGSGLRRKLKRSAKKVKQRVEGKSVQRAAAEAATKVLQLSSELRNPPKLSASNLHAYRLKVKELRYVLQLADDSKHNDFIAKLSEVKDAIGDWHDWEELIGIAEKLKFHEGNCGLLERLKDISRQKFETAFSSAEQLRSEYVSFRNKRNGARRKPRSLVPVELAAELAA